MKCHNCTSRSDIRTYSFSDSTKFPANPFQTTVRDFLINTVAPNRIVKYARP